MFDDAGPGADGRAAAKADAPEAGVPEAGVPGVGGVGFVGGRVVVGSCVARGGFVVVGVKASMLALIGFSLVGVHDAVLGAHPGPAPAPGPRAEGTGDAGAGDAGAGDAGAGDAGAGDAGAGDAGAGDVGGGVWLSGAVLAGQGAFTAVLTRARAATQVVLAEQFALAQALDEHVPDAALVDLLEELDLPAVHDVVLVEAAAGWERVISLATARQGQVIAELARRREGAGLGEFTGDEIASRLVLTRSVADAKLTLALALASAPQVHTALATGILDHRKATALTTGVAHLDPTTAAAVLDVVVPHAPALTVPAVKAKLRKAELAINPGEVADRHARDRADRHVRITPAAGTTAMAWLTAFLPADDAMTVFTAIDAIAASADPTDPRGIEARRADALTDVCTDILTHGTAPTTALPGRPGGALKTEHGHHPHLHVTAAATTLLGLDEVPGDLAGYGPIPAHLVRAIAQDATWRRIFTDPATGNLTGIGPRGYRPGADLTNTILARDTTCTFPGCRTPARRCDLDHRDPFDHDHPDHGGPTHETNLHTLCRHHHRLKTYAGWKVDLDSTTGNTWWTSPTHHRYLRPATQFNPHPPPTLTPLPPQNGDPPF